MTKKKLSRSSPVKGAVIIGLIKLLAFMPFPISGFVTGVMSRLSYRLNSNGRWVTSKNLSICYPELSDSEREEMTRQSMLASGRFLAETAKIWVKPAEKILPMVTEVVGREIFDKAVDDPEKGVLLITPHLGNWELLNTYITSHYEISALYRPPKIAELEPLILKGRQQSGGELIKTSQMEVRKMLKVLKSAGTLVILPDQQPQLGSGVMAPFFGYPAYTMTLLHRLAKRTGAEIIMASCIRQKQGFKIEYSPTQLDPELSSEAFAEQLNLNLQREINKAPAQYEWAYKRFKACMEGDIDIYNRRTQQGNT